MAKHHNFQGSPPAGFPARAFLRLTIACLFLSIVLAGGKAATAQLSTEDHLAEPGFWPTKAQDAQAAFAGPESCAHCHAGIAASAMASSMGRTANASGTSAALQHHPHTTFKAGADTFRIDSDPNRNDARSMYSVSRGDATLRFPLQWIFGTDRVGQSYLFKKDDGHFYEARVTFYQSLQGIAFTPARESTPATDLATTMGRQVDTAELIRCFSCHATAVNIHDSFNESGLRGGVTCEACHGPGAAHVTAMSGTAPDAARGTAPIFEPSHLSPTESVEFCGACHGSWWDVKLAHVTGPSTVRSAPYRLVTSKCWGKNGDARLKCTACHDPHKELATEVSSYDHACLQCHSGSVTAAVSGKEASTAHAPMCTVARNKCVSCHMPQVYVPEMKNTFTDHRIRIVRAGEAFQD